MADVRAIAIKRLAKELRDVYYDWKRASARGESFSQAILLCKRFLERYECSREKRKDIENLIEALKADKKNAELEASLYLNILLRIEQEISTVLGECWEHSQNDDGGEYPCSEQE